MLDTQNWFEEINFISMGRYVFGPFALILINLGRWLVFSFRKAEKDR